jgi:adenine-specific DNA-methyltransferase
MFETYGIRFAGSKLKLLPAIENLIKSTGSKYVLDAFSGTTRVSQYLAQHGYHVTCNDISPISKVFGECFLLNGVPQDDYKELINHLNNLKPIDGWFTEKYGGTASSIKKPFQIHNTRKLDAIREEIDNIFGLAHSMPNTLVDSYQLDIQKSTILASLLLALDKVDSTLGHQAAYLKNWSKRSFDTLHLEIPNYIVHTEKHTVLQKSAGEIDLKVDLAFFDPPYGTNSEKAKTSRVRYDSYYHIYKSVILNDKPTVFGRNNRRLDSKDAVALSDFESTDKNTVKTAFKQLLKIKAKYFLFSYSSTSKLNVQDELIPLIAEQCDIISVSKIDHKKHAMANMSWTNEWLNTTENFEYLVLAKK